MWRANCVIIKPTWVCPAISTPASRNSSKSWLNFPEAAASWLLVPRDEWTTSPAEWLSSAAVWFRSVWASWNVLLQGGSFKDRTRYYAMLHNTRSGKTERTGSIMWISCRTHKVHQQLLAGFSDAPQSHIDILLAWQAVHTVVQGVRHRFGNLRHSNNICQWTAITQLNNVQYSKAREHICSGGK